MFWLAKENLSCLEPSVKWVNAWDVMKKYTNNFTNLYLQSTHVHTVPRWSTIIDYKFAHWNITILFLKALRITWQMNIVFLTQTISFVMNSITSWSNLFINYQTVKSILHVTDMFLLMAFQTFMGQFVNQRGWPSTI